MAGVTAILDKNGDPMRPAMPSRRGGRRADTDGGRVDTEGPFRPSVFPYQAAAWQTQEMADWLPWIRSPDSEINQFRDRMVARSRDLVRNDGWASGGIIRILDNTVGSKLRLSAKPDYRALSYTDKAFDAVWAHEFRRAVEAKWRTFSEDVGHYNDVSRQITVGDQHRLALNHKLVDGEALVVNYWLPDRVGPGAATYATSFLVVDPDRLSNPYQSVDQKYLRGGVEIDDHGVPIAYNIRAAHQNDYYNTIESMVWERVPREDPDGWRRVIHDFERGRAGQNRGVGVFTPVIARMKMLARYYGVELQAATISATFGTYVKSPYDSQLIENMMDGRDDELSFYQGLRSEWSEKRGPVLNGARIMTLAPGEDIVSTPAQHPHNAFEEFAHEMLRSMAAALGVSTEQITQDWSKTNYSSARAALLESWKTLVRRRHQFSIGVATPMYATWMGEAMESGDLPLPNGAPSYVEAATAYSRCHWLGPGRGWIDPVKERQGSVLGMDAGLSTLEQECAENMGADWEEIIEQRKLELEKFKELGIEPPSWANMQGGPEYGPENAGSNEETATSASRPKTPQEPT